ncbi:hypothetical protein K2173_013757 [Erythroxylum novogranatense]|uniref:Thioredoxin-like fold domain-containing protein MRL7, chloroplastic n=1 Tax=Erythroxylum novogranatense TaxID=1862640 RepID=A0AAV8SAT7_9ROSI|nr:hypothetical protein K2173_013757 [Erythroxylum novogranatense]
MFLLGATIMPKSFSPLHSMNVERSLLHLSLASYQDMCSNGMLTGRWDSVFPPSLHCWHLPKTCTYFAVSRKYDSETDPESSSKPKTKPKRRTRLPESENSQLGSEDSERVFPKIIPRKPRRGRKSEAAAVEDYVRGTLERTFAAIGKRNPELFENKGSIIKERVDDEVDSDEDEDEEVGAGDDDVGRGKGKRNKFVVEQESPNWPLDADVGWGVRASEYFDKYPIKNVVGEDGAEINWEGELDDTWIKEINCLEWESFAFHPSPLIVLVFERYNRATDNWKTLKELEKAALVYWQAKDRLPPRTVKIDINIERDLAYALKVKECPQILFLRGNQIVYRESDFRTADELVQMIAHFYYNAKKPSCINNAS